MNLSAQDRVKQTEKITYICMFGNIALAVLKILTGIFGASAAMIADGVHSFSDLVTDIVLLVGVAGAMFLGPKWRLLDPLTAALVSLFIAAVGFKIFKMPYLNFSTPPFPKVAWIR